MPYVKNLTTGKVNLINKDLWNHLKTCADRQNYKLEMPPGMTVEAPKSEKKVSGPFGTPNELEDFLRGENFIIPVKEGFATPNIFDEPEVGPVKRKRGRPRKIIGA